jgi:endoglycosylceramidase
LRALAVATVALGLAPTLAAAAPTAPIKNNGRWLTDARGRVVVLHGVNMVFKRPPYAPSAAGFDAADARFLRREGFNTVRLGVIYKGVEPSPGSYDDAYLGQIAATVKQLSKQGIFTLLDFHQDLYNERFQGEGFPDWAVQDDGLPALPQAGFPGNYLGMPALNRAFDHFWNNDPGPGGVGLQDRYADAWRHVALRFRSVRQVMGYDLLNEPWPGTGWQACANTEGCRQFDEQKLTPFSRRVTDRIRQVDRKKTVWYEPNVIYNNGPKTWHGDTGPNAGMSFHEYCLSGGDCGPLEELPFENANTQSDRTGDAQLLTEFGASDDLAGIERMIERADRFMVGWQYWHYCQCDDPTTSGAGPAQAVVIDPKQPPSGANVKAEKLALLARPYPQAVAGTPRAFDYDRDSGRFDLSYSTRRVGGGRFRFRADTLVRVPKRLYGKGYNVRVKGGQAISKRNSSALRVRACRGRREVSVLVKPGRGRRAADCRARRTKR